MLIQEIGKGLGGGLDETSNDGDAFSYGNSVLIELVQKSTIGLYYGFFWTAYCETVRKWNDLMQFGPWAVPEKI